MERNESKVWKKANLIHNTNSERMNHPIKTTSS